MKRKIVTISLLVALLAVVIIGGSLAYFTADDEATNTFTVGNVAIELTEPEWDKAVTNKENEDMYPGQTIAKDPTVKNTGKNVAFIALTVTELDQFGTKGDIVYSTGGTASALGTNWALGEAWSTDLEGLVFYYLVPVDPEASTTAVFDSITLPLKLVNNEETKPIVVKAYAVQAQGITAADPAAPTAAELKAWFGAAFGAE